MKVFVAISLISLITLSAIAGPASTGVNPKITESVSISNVKSVAEQPAGVDTQVTDGVTQANTKVLSDSAADGMVQTSQQNPPSTGVYFGGGLAVGTTSN
ncbi:MAG: hypothetical protein COV52_10200 [Gammaproteobacteria bacterium CG11_big_fil_rev_8_21_14_0_20_46_22]|nr:MAG: hypothetical protein COW05_09425 [Gammaproteobacteria bacterium CG12_big_fil_rev_8_21_14_0_65_46_12]PIR10068.1 MAG: hypothetical protein COV52_10200 [Gammaproteobacteria bacterium CG11_big_fil_rev_8_21_14_0_20_46_22]